MTRIEKITREELRRVRAATESAPATEEQDEMAIPSYLHPNPLVRWIVWRRHVLIAELAQLNDQMEILDFGCGPGVLLPTLCAHGGRVNAIDLFPEIARRLCKERQLDVRFHTDIDSIDDASLDLIIAAEVLEHIDEGLDDLLDSFDCKLKPRGRLLVSVPVEGRLYRLGRLLAGFGKKAHYHHHKGADLLTRIADRGFLLRRVRGIPFSTMPSLYLVGEFETKSA